MKGSDRREIRPRSRRAAGHRDHHFGLRLHRHAVCNRRRHRDGEGAAFGHAVGAESQPGRQRGRVIIGDRDRGRVDIGMHQGGGQCETEHLLRFKLLVVEDRHRECLGLVLRPIEHQHRGGRGVVAPGGRRPVRGRDCDRDAPTDRSIQRRGDRHRVVAFPHRGIAQGDRRPFIILDRDRGGGADTNQQRSARQGAQRDGERLIRLNDGVAADRHLDRLHLPRRPEKKSASPR